MSCSPSIENVDAIYFNKKQPHVHPLRRSARLLQSEKFKSQQISQPSTPSKKSVKPKLNVAYKPSTDSSPHSQPKHNVAYKLGGVLEDAKNGCRRSSRLASATGVKTIESPQQLLHKSSRRNPKTSDEPEAIIKSNPKKRPKSDCESASSQVRRSARRLTPTVTGVMKRGVTLNVEDRVGEVEERVNTERGDLRRKTVGLEKQKKRKMEEGNGVKNRIEKRKKEGRHVVTAGWTNVQEEALHKAYLKAKPSPHFWKKVSRMVPGKTAQDCFDKIHASIITPLSSQPRSKTRAHGFSPVANFSLSDMISPQASKLEAGKLGNTRTKKFAAHKTVRHLLRKHSIIDRSKVIDHFALLESSLINKSSPATLRSLVTSLSQRPYTKPPSNSKMVSRFKLLNSPTSPSPEVLKQIKNRALHDRYIDQLHHRAARRAILAKKSNAGGVGGKSDHGGLKAARNALISDAVSFVKQFGDSQANTAHELEEGEDDDCYGDYEDVNGDDVDE